MIPAFIFSLGAAAAPIQPVVSGATAEEAVHVLLGAEDIQVSNCNDAGTGNDQAADNLWGCTTVDLEAGATSVGVLADGVFVSAGVVEIPEDGGRLGLVFSASGLNTKWNPEWEGEARKTARGPGITWVARLESVTSEAAPVIALSGFGWRSEAWCQDDGSQFDQSSNDGTHVCVGILPSGAGKEIEVGRRSNTGDDLPFGTLTYDKDEAVRFAVLDASDPSSMAAKRFPLPIGRNVFVDMPHADRSLAGPPGPASDAAGFSGAGGSGSSPPGRSGSPWVMAILLGIIGVGTTIWWRTRSRKGSRVAIRTRSRSVGSHASYYQITTAPPGWRRPVMALFGVSILGLGGLEWWAQGQEAQLPTWVGPGGDAALMTGHPTRLWGMTPGNKQNGPSASAFINEFGLRGELPPIPRPKSRHRILTLGDSAFFGHGVNDKEVFTTQLQNFFEKRDMAVDVINGGIAGYSVAQHQILMDEDGWNLEPTLVVFCNLWSDNTWDSFHDEDLLRSRQFAHLNPLTRSSFVKLLAVWLADISGAKRGRIITWSNEDGWPEDKVRRVPLKRWATIHDELMRQASGRGVGSVMLLPSNTFLIDQAETNGPPPAWTPYFRAMEQLAEHHGVPVFDVSKGFNDAISDGVPGEDVFMDLMHPTPMGHQIMAEALGEALIAEGWPAKSFHAQGDAFDASVLEDVPNPGWFDDEGAGSPQTNLFRINAETQQKISSQAEEMRSQGPPPPLGVDDGPAGPTPSWVLDVTVQGGTPPIHVVVEDTEQRPVGRATMLRSGQFQISMHMGVDEVTVRAEDKSGRVSTVVGGQDASEIVLGWPG